MLSVEGLMVTGVPLLSLRKQVKSRKIHALGCVLVYMSGHRLSVDGILSDSLLIDTHSSDSTQRTGVDFGAPIRDDADNDLLPTILPPSFAPISFAQVGDVLYHTVHGSSEEFLVFVVHSENNEQLSPPGGIVQDLTQGESGVLEIVGIASCS